MDRLRAHDITLTGDGVVLRPMTELDWPLILAINNDPEIAYFTEGGEWQPYSLERLQQIYRGISEHAFMFVIVHGDGAIGECWLQRMNVPRVLNEFPGRDVRRIDIAIGAKHLWGKGLGTEALRLLVKLAFKGQGIDLLICFASGHNSRSRRAFEKAGFTVLRTVPGADDQKSGFGYDLVLTRQQYEHAPTSTTGPPRGDGYAG